jgi:hypothetical protein
VRAVAFSVASALFASLLVGCGARAQPVNDRAWVDDLLHKHAAGATVIVSGADLADFLKRAQVAANTQADNSYTCPPTVDLSGLNHVTCIVSFAGQTATQRLDVSLGNSLYVEPLDKIVNLDRMGQRGSYDLNMRRQAKGLPGNAVFACGHGLLTVAIGEAVHCFVRVNGQTRPVDIKVSATGIP